MGLIKLIILLIFSLGSNASKLNVPRVLLPLFRDFQTNFTLEVTDAGCYNWSPLRPNTVRVQCLDPDIELGCCSRVVVAAATKEFRRDTETILAEDVDSGLVFRCEVILDVIHSLTIVTTTREMLLDESPEAFEVRAYDEQGNEFSTLDGVELEWNLRTVGANNKSGESTVVRYMTFAESTYEAPRSIEAIERQGLKGHIVLLEGKQTGGASVTVRLPQPEYSNVPTAGVQLLVRTNLLIFPQEATILKGDNIAYRLQQFQQGKVSEIKFPSTQYHLISEDPSVDVDVSSGTATGVDIGKSRIVLIDRNGVETDVKPPTASLNVAMPHELSLAVLPARKWTVVIGQSYDIITELYDVDRRRFHIGDNAELGINLDERYFRVDIRPRNGSYVHGVPLKEGRTKVIAELLGVKDPLGGINKLGSLKAAQDLHIYKPISVLPETVIIPWDPIAKARYDIPFTATGGDGAYTWSSMRSAVAIISQRGVAKTLEMGSTTIVAAMNLNPTIRGTSILRVVPPIALEILNTALEAEIGRPIPVYVGLYGEVDGKRVPFTTCDLIPFEVTIPDPNFQQVKVNSTQRPNPACGTIFIEGITPGATQIDVKYGSFSASAVIAAYRPLAPLNPSSGTTLLAVGTSRLIVFSGGPRSWALKPSEHRYELQNSHHNIEDLEVNEQQSPLAAQKDTYPFLVSCHQLSETILPLRVVNKVVGSNSEPTVTTASITVICGKPKYLQLTPVVKNITKCPLQAEEIVALSYKNLELEVIVKDAQGRRFDNISSLEINWSISKESLVKVLEPMKALTVEQDGFTFPGQFVQVLTTSGKTGMAEVKGKITGYNAEVLFAQSIIPESPAFPERNSNGVYKTPDIRSALSIRLVNATQVSPNKTEIFAGDGEERELRVKHGSGHYEITASVPGVVSIQEEGRILRVKAVDVGSVSLLVSDVCLDTDAVSVSIQVYRIGAITLDVTEYIERGNSIQAHVSLFDENGDALTALPTANVLKLTPLVGSEIISVSAVTSTSPTRAFVFNVKALSLGETTLSVSAGEIFSRTAPIHVFPPLRLSPRNVTLLVGSSIQVTTADGPPGAHLEFSLDRPAAQVSIDGVIEGLHIGDCSLTARAVVIHRETGQKIIASQDKVDVQVLPLKEISIHTPIKTIVAGGKMPIWAVGPPGTVAVLRLGLSSSASTFAWSVSQDSCAEIRTVFHDIGLFVPNNDKVVMRFLAIKPGRVVVTLTVRVPGSVAGTAQAVEYSNSVTINIIPDISLRSPRPMTLEHLLISPKASTELRLARDIQRFQSTVTVLRGDADVVKVSQDGILSSGPKTGAAVIAFGHPEKPWRHLIVYVKPVEYIMVNSVPRWRLLSSERLSAVPTGLDIDLSISFHDDEGNEFDAVRSNIVAKSDQKGLVNLARGTDNKTLIMSLLDSGTSLVSVWDANNINHPTDYLPTRSDDVFFPPNIRVSVGDVICLRMPIISAEDVGTSWAVENPAKLRLWPELGVAVPCEQSGLTTLFHQSSPRLRSRIEIAPIQRIDLLPHDDMLTTAPGSVIDYPLVLSASGERGKVKNKIAFNNSCSSTPKDFSPSCYPFVCKLELNNPIASDVIDTFFHVTPSFNLETGVYSCRVQSIAKPSVASATFSEVLVLRAITLDGVMSRVSVVPLTPALFLHQNQIKVSHSEPSDSFTLSGTKEVFDQIDPTPTDKHLAKVSLHSQTETSRTYKVSVDLAWWTLEDPPTISVNIWSKLTGQKLQVGVRCGGLRVESEDSWFSLMQWIVIIVIGVLSVIFGCFCTHKLSEAKTRQSVQTSDPPFLRTPTFEETLLHAHSRSTSLHSQEPSPLRTVYEDHPIYGSPWRRGNNSGRRD